MPIRFWRTEREEFVDSLLTLALFHICAPQGYVGDRLKATKLTFVVTLEAFRNRYKGFNFSFYRYSWGPFTSELHQTWGDLQWAGLVDIRPGPAGSLGLTDEGRDLATRFVREVLAQGSNETLLRILYKVADSYAGCSTREILQKVYSLQVVPIGWTRQITVGATPVGEHFTMPIDEDKAVSAVDIPDSWLKAFDLRRRRIQGEVADVERFFHPVIIEALDEALAADLRGEGKRLTVEDVNRIKKEYGIS